MPNADDKAEFARLLRAGQTPSEARLWEILRDRRCDGHKFRRQRQIGPYIADFCCIAAKLVVELDGDSHIGREAYDTARTNCLRDNAGYVLRFENFEAMLTENLVVETILRICRLRCPKAD